MSELPYETTIRLSRTVNILVAELWSALSDEAKRGLALQGISRSEWCWETRKRVWEQADDQF